MTTPSTEKLHSELLARFREREPAALARVVSIVENHRPGFEAILSEVHHLTGRACRIGMTGPPGAGKSTLTGQLARAYRDRGLTVGVVAVDPTSPFTGGALLGDRIRMDGIALDPGIFIRSMATRGSLGGLAVATREVCDVLDGFGMDVILIETVGVGQSELDVARAADTTVVVLVPESGDAIQTLKAGVMEIADVFVVNKADRPGATQLRRDISLMLGLRGTGKRLSDHMTSGPEHWTPPVLESVAASGAGVGGIVDAIDSHRRFLENSGELRARRRQRLRERVIDVVEHQIRSRLWRDRPTLAWLEEQLDSLEDGSATPFEVADRLRARSVNLLTGSLFK